MERKTTTATINLNSEIYKKEAIQEAISIYSHIAKFSLVQNRKYTKVKINQIPLRFAATIIDEFANYVLGATKKCL